ncbi:MAG: hypothetical protein PHY36_00175 [Methanocellales archaeon]|nr:hypothetical protein [Methanocellales archaeon]
MELFLSNTWRAEDALDIIVIVGARPMQQIRTMRGRGFRQNKKSTEFN